MTAKIKLNAASGGGSVSIQAPSSSSNDRTLSLPSDGDGVLAKTDTSGNLTVLGNLNTSNINGGQLGSRRLTINGDMRIAQRGTSSTTSGYGTVDRWQVAYIGHDEAITQSQVDVVSGTTPYSLGFRKALRATNGNQTSGATNSAAVIIYQKIEAQDIANSGWNYTDPNSKITLSFWVKSSVAQNFYVRLTSIDGTQQGFAIETGSLTADTWTKVTKTIPGNSNLTFDNNSDQGLQLIFDLFLGTNYTDSSASLDTWSAYGSGATRSPDQTSTWYTTNDATFEVTGVQLEVGSTATSFEFRTFAQEEMLCRRYFQKAPVSSSGAATTYGCRYSTSSGFVIIKHVPPMRAVPSLSWTARATSAGFAYSNYSGDELTQILMTAEAPYITGYLLDAEL